MSQKERREEKGRDWVAWQTPAEEATGVLWAEKRARSQEDKNSFEIWGDWNKNKSDLNNTLRWGGRGF